MTRKKQPAPTADVSPPSGVPYEIDGRRVSLGEYRAWRRDQNRQSIVEALRSDPGESEPAKSTPANQSDPK